MSSDVPAICYAACSTLTNPAMYLWADYILPDNAYIEAQQTGETPALCEANSTFVLDYSKCTQCITLHSGDSASNNSAFTIEFSRFVDYCSNLTAANANTDASRQILFSELAAASTLSSLISVYSSLISSKASTTSSPTISPTSSATHLSSSKNPYIYIPKQKHSNQLASNPTQTPVSKQRGNPDWIAGAVLGPVILILIPAIALYWFVREKRKRITPIMENPDFQQEKPQLHGDSLIAPRYELQSERSPNIPLEMPAREPAAAELHGDSNNNNRRTTSS